MKARMLLLSLVFFFLLGNQVFTQTSEQNITVEMELESVGDEAFGIVECMPYDFTGVAVASGGTMTGEVSYIGNLIPEESIYEVSLCRYGPESKHVTMSMKGTMTGESGDYFVFYSERVINTVTGEFTGTMNLVDGSGAFKGITAELKTEGKMKLNSDKAKWKASGTMKFAEI